MQVTKPQNNKAEIETNGAPDTERIDIDDFWHFIL